jgi:uncharacterized protein YpmS
VLLLVFVGVFAGVVVAAGWWMSRQPPKWYSSRKATPAQVAEAAHRAEQQVQRTLSWAQDQQAFAASSRVGSPSTRPASTLQISLTEDELNGFFQKWDSAFGWSGTYGQYVEEPQIVLQDGRMIFAATVKSIGSVISVEFDPRMKDGKLQMPVEQVMAGRLPVPQGFWSGYRMMLEERVNAALPDWQEDAEIEPDGTANTTAVEAGMSELLVDLLEGRLARPILFLPYSVGKDQRSLPVKVTAIQIANKTLMLSVEPLTPAERDSLIDSIRAPRTPQAGANDVHTASSQ